MEKIRNGIPEIWKGIPEIRNGIPEIRNGVPEIRNGIHGIRNGIHRIRNSIYGIRNRIHGIRNGIHLQIMMIIVTHMNGEDYKVYSLCSHTVIEGKQNFLTWDKWSTGIVISGAKMLIDIICLWLELFCYFPPTDQIVQGPLSYNTIDYSLKEYFF